MSEVEGTNKKLPIRWMKKLKKKNLWLENLISRPISVPRCWNYPKFRGSDFRGSSLFQIYLTLYRVFTQTLHLVTATAHTANPYTADVSVTNFVNSPAGSDLNIFYQPCTNSSWFSINLIVFLKIYSTSFICHMTPFPIKILNLNPI